MGLQYRKVKFKSNVMEGKPEVYKLQQLTYPMVSYAQLVKECSKSCGINIAQTQGVVDALLDRIAHYMELGHGVKVGDFGSFKPVFNSKVALSSEEATVETIKRKKILFYPGKTFRDMLGELSVTSASEILNTQD